jgi:hypothetical protein
MINELIEPIVILLCCLILGGIFLFITKKSKRGADIDKSKITAQNFINVKEIRDKFLYTNDGYVFIYIQIPSIDINLLSKREKEVLTNTLTANLSSEQNEFKFLALSKPVDVEPLINDYHCMMNETNNYKQKELLRYEIASLGNYALSGEVVERQFYFMFWEKYSQGVERELLKQASEFVSKFEGTNIKPQILTENKIFKLCNLVNNPAYINEEDDNYRTSSPIIIINN